MKFVFDYEETLLRRVTIDADSLADAIKELEHQIDNEIIVLNSEDFVGGKIRMPLAENFLPQLQLCGESIKDKANLDIVIDIF